MFPILSNLKAIILRQEKKGTIPSPWGPDWGWDWGWRIHPILKEKKWHNGIDLPAPTGTPIFAPWAGTVITVGYDETNGNYIKISHNPTNAENIKETAYVHLSETWVSQGQVVSAGEQIGAVGSTGRSTGPHLHFITRGKTKSVVEGVERRDTNPLPLLKASVGLSTGAGIFFSMLIGSALLAWWYWKH